MGGDVLAGRPTVLWALALERLSEADGRQLEQLIAGGEATPAVIDQVRTLYERAAVFDEAARLVAKHQERAAAVADQLQPDALRRLAWYLIDTVLEWPAAAGKTRVPLAVPAR
jgi:hypothetical protein